MALLWLLSQPSGGTDTKYPDLKSCVSSGCWSGRTMRGQDRLWGSVDTWLRPPEGSGQPQPWHKLWKNSPPGTRGLGDWQLCVTPVLKFCLRGLFWGFWGAASLLEAALPSVGCVPGRHEPPFPCLLGGTFEFSPGEPTNSKPNDSESVSLRIGTWINLLLELHVREGTC